MARSYQTGTLIKQKLQDGSFSCRLKYRERRPSDGVWVQKVEPLGHFRSQADIKEAQQEFMKGVNARNAGVLVITEGLTFKAFVEKYWQAYLDKENIRQSSRDGYASALNRWIIPYFGTFPLSGIVKETVSGFMITLDKQHKLSGSYRKNIYNLLSLLFRMARAYDLIQFSPVEPFLHRPSVVHREKPVLTIDQAKKLFAALPEQWQSFTFVLLTTGMRQGELLGLRWLDVDFGDRLIHKRNVVYKGKLVEGLKQTGKKKSGRPRKHQVGIPTVLEGVLKDHQKNQEKLFKALRRELDGEGRALKPEDYVFCQDDGRPVNPDHFRRYVLYPALEAAEIVEKQQPKKEGEKVRGRDRAYARAFGLHMFRHTAVSEIVKHMGLKLAQEQAGHSDISTTADIYTHVDIESKLAAASVLEEAFKGVLVLDPATSEEGN